MREAVGERGSGVKEAVGESGRLLWPEDQWLFTHLMTEQER